LDLSLFRQAGTAGWWRDVSGPDSIGLTAEPAASSYENAALEHAVLSASLAWPVSAARGVTQATRAASTAPVSESPAAAPRPAALLMAGFLV